MLTEKLLAIDNSTLKPILLQNPKEKPPMYNPLDYDVAVAIDLGSTLIKASYLLLQQNDLQEHFFEWPSDQKDDPEKLRGLPPVCLFVNGNDSSYMWGHHAENYRLTYFSGFKKKIKNITVIDEFSNVLGCIFKHPKKIREFYRPERYENEDGFIVEVKETEKDVAKKIDDFLKADEKIYQGGLEKDNLNEKEKEIHDMSLEDLNATYDKILLFFQKMHYHLEEEIKRMHSTHRITYILTVPTNWSDYALEGIRQIALKANFVKEKDHERRFWIRRNNITTRLGLYYSNGDQSLLKRGFGHLVCDVGGTSTTIDAFQISGTHKELKIGDNGYKDILKKSIPRHYNFGSNDLDDNMEILLVDHLFGSNRDISVVNKYKRDIFECLRQFQIEYKTREMATYLKGDEIEFKANKRLLNAPEKSKELDPAKEGQFTIKSKTMEQYVFEPVWNDIKECVDQTIKAPNMPVIDHIYLVGGLSKSHQLHRLFQDNFKHVKIHSQVFAEFLSTESLANSGALYCAYTIFNEFSSVPQLVDKLNFRDDNFQRIYTHYDVGIESSNFSILVKGKEGDKVDFKQELEMNENYKNVQIYTSNIFNEILKTLESHQFAVGNASDSSSRSKIYNAIKANRVKIRDAMPDMIADIKDNASNISADYYLDGANVGHTAVEYSTSAYEDFAPTSDIKKGMTFAEQQETAGILLTLYFATFHHWAHNYLDTHFEMLKEKKFYHSITIDNIHGYDLPKSYMRGLAVTAGIVNEEDKHKQLLILKREESSALAVKNEVYKLSQEEAERQIKEQEEINEKEKEKKAEDPDDPESERYWTKKKWKETKSVFILQIHLSQTSCFMSLDESTQIDTFKNQELEEWRKKPVVLTIKSENVPFNMLEMVRNKIWQNTSTTKDSIFQITFCEKHKATAKFNGTQYNKFVHMFNKYIDKECATFDDPNDVHNIPIDQECEHCQNSTETEKCNGCEQCAGCKLTVKNIDITELVIEPSVNELSSIIYSACVENNSMFAKYKVDHALIMGGIMPRNTVENKVNKQIIAILEDDIYDKLLLRHRRTQQSQTSMFKSLKSLNSTMLDGALDARYHPEDALSQYVSNVGIAIIVKRQRADLTTYKDVKCKDEIQLEKPFWILERGDVIDDDALKHGISTTLYTKHYNYEDVFDDEFFIDDDEEEELEEEEVDDDEESVDDVFLNTFKIDIFATSEKIKEEDKNDEEYFLGGFSLRYAGRAGKLVNLAELWHYINVRIYPSIGSYKVHVNHVYLGEFENPLMVKENTLLRINDNDD